MKPICHIHATDIQHAAFFLKKPDSAAIAGGTDLLTELKKRIRTPQKLINLKTIPGMRYIQSDNGRLRIGALTTVADIETNSLVAEQAPLLQQASGLVGSPQIRNMGTLGGNLCQRVRCWYYRHPQVQCWLKGGQSCFAREGINRHHAIFGQSPCVAVNPSDIAPALIALDAEVQLTGIRGSKTIAVEELYRLPVAAQRRQTKIGATDLIVEISIPVRSNALTRGRYLKLMERATWSFALASAAVRLDWEKNRITQGRIVLGGVAGMPWRARTAEKLLIGRRIDDSLARQVSAAAVSEAKPLKWNAYKIPMIKNLIKKALLELKALSV
jgi:xanthine dehydrogenase YagS FAD-binding subunit